MSKALKLIIVIFVAIGLTSQPGVANAGKSPTAGVQSLGEVSLKAPKNSSQSFSGSGDDIITVKLVSQSVLVTMTHDGESNFSVTSKTRDDDYIDLLANEIGPYSGTVIQELGTSSWNKDKLGLLEVSADGNWKIVIKPLTKAKKWDGKPLSGTGDLVVLVPGKTKPGSKLVMSHKGNSNFAVTTYSAKGGYLDLKANEIGNYSGKSTFGRAYYIAIETQGKWTIKKK